MKSRSPLWTICPSLKWISVSVPPTWARNSTRSIAENWPRKPTLVSTARCKGWLTVTSGAGVSAATALASLVGRQTEPDQKEPHCRRADERRCLPSPPARPCRRFVQPFSFEVRRVGDLIHDSIRKSLPCCPEFGCGTVPPAARWVRCNNRRGEVGIQVVVIAVEKLRAGLISGASTPICCAADRLGEA